MKADDVHQKVVEVEKLIAGIFEQLKYISKAQDAQNKGQRETSDAIRDLKLTTESRLVALEKDIAEFRRWTEKNGISELRADLGVLKEKTAKVEGAQEKIGTRAWSIVPNVIGAIVSGAIAAIVAYVVSRSGK